MDQFPHRGLSVVDVRTEFEADGREGGADGSPGGRLSLKYLDQYQESIPPKGSDVAEIGQASISLCLLSMQYALIYYGGMDQDPHESMNHTDPGLT